MRTVAELTNLDKSKLKNEKKISYAFIVLVISVGLLFNLSYLIAFKEKLSFKSLIFIDLMFAIIPILIYYLMNKKINKDLKSNTKVITLVKIDEKIVVNTEEAGSGVLYIPILGELFPRLWGQKMKDIETYYLLIKGFRHEVDREFYESVNIGEEVERHSSKYSKTFLGFSKAEFFE